MKQMRDKVKSNIPSLKTCAVILLLVLFAIGCVNEYLQYQRQRAQEVKDLYLKAINCLHQHDDKQGLTYLKEAAEKGHVRSQMLMGSAYEFGTGVKRDCNQALYWYHKAEENGYAFATTRIGWMYLHGKCYKKDLQKAAEWFKKAAEKGDEHAQYSLKCIEEGKIK